MNLHLKMAILESGLSQRNLAKMTGIHESVISMAVQGKYNLDQFQRAKISKAIGKPKEVIFHEHE